MSKAKTTKKPAANKAPKNAKAPQTAPVEKPAPSEKPVAATGEETKAESTPAKKRGTKQTDGEAKTKAKKLSAIDAAAQVVAAASEPMTCKALIEAMAAQGLWTSPGGKTPAATLYSAIVREINVKGDEARFKKTQRGLFTSNN